MAGLAAAFQSTEGSLSACALATICGLHTLLEPYLYHFVPVPIDCRTCSWTPSTAAWPCRTSSPSPRQAGWLLRGCCALVPGRVCAPHRGNCTQTTQPMQHPPCICLHCRTTWSCPNYGNHLSTFVHISNKLPAFLPPLQDNPELQFIFLTPQVRPGLGVLRCQPCCGSGACSGCTLWIVVRCICTCASRRAVGQQPLPTSRPVFLIIPHPTPPHLLLPHRTFPRWRTLARPARQRGRSSQTALCGWCRCAPPAPTPPAHEAAAAAGRWKRHLRSGRGWP